MPSRWRRGRRSISTSLCYDCLQTRGDQIADRVRWEAELEAEFNNAQQEP